MQIFLCFNAKICRFSIHAEEIWHRTTTFYKGGYGTFYIRPFEIRHFQRGPLLYRWNHWIFAFTIKVFDGKIRVEYWSSSAWVGFLRPHKVKGVYNKSYFWEWTTYNTFLFSEVPCVWLRSHFNALNFIRTFKDFMSFISRYCRTLNIGLLQSALILKAISLLKH